jgi:hypothetical protein
MKKIFDLLAFFVFVIVLTSCRSEKAIALENPQIELFNVIYESDEYSIFIRTDIDAGQSFYKPAYTVGIDGETCIVGEEQKYNYRILYNEKYYDIVEANKFSLFTCSELREIGVIGD